MAPANIPHAEAASTLAVITWSNEPLLFLTGDLTIIAASVSFCRTFQITPESVTGRRLSELGDGEWDMPRLGSLLKATALGSAEIQAYEIDLVRKDRKPRYLVLNARKLDEGDAGYVRILLAITDVTVARAEARQKDELLREKAVLLQEIQHRVANSLQIIASLLMRSARRVQSEEARGHLHDAHHRVMSIAAVQRHLAVYEPGDVPLRPYFVQLCESLGASMIFDPTRLSIIVTVDDSVAAANESVSLGLVVTELVINALKYAFPDYRRGTIAIDYRSIGANWTLSVRDDGVGMSTGADKPKPGLGTGIVEALSKQLGSVVRVDDGNPGTTITLVHDQAAGGDSDLPAAA
ncbi:sensor histidine kinase [Labrys monachus]|uniref:histidine kinase n=1 Tax=Labrys monachus TaxID=217067 RepID=A0ABU0FK99_9HYPH|nr:histidine kinase dimerization/phosphoacceptor domain -containing protein [Labrys monachus]MDQ0395037.1 two-component sensor histidine kinase [Labrys monachus]